jgi:amino acid transporter
VLPSWSTVVLLGVVVYNFLGFELMSSASEEMRDARRDVPRSILTAGLLIGSFYLIATIGMLLIVPVTGFGRVGGLYRALEVGIGSTGLAHVAVVLLGIGALYCFFAALVPWTIGANRSAAEAARHGDLPPVLGRTSRRFRTPVAAAVTTALVGTTFTLASGWIVSLGRPSVETLFWNLFAFSTLVFLLSYLVMAFAFLRLRLRDKETARPYRVPGGVVGAWLTTLLVFGFILLATVFFVWTPGAAVDMTFVQQMVGGLVIVLGIGLLFAWRAPAWRRRADATPTPFEHPEARAQVQLEGVAPDDLSVLTQHAPVEHRPLRMPR